MKLLNVEVVLKREQNIQQTKYEPVLSEMYDGTTSYAILSHRWGVEVAYKEMAGLMRVEELEKDEVRARDGYQKIIKSCEQAKEDGYKWLWIDTCCIDKRSSSELSETINSMYRWYQNAQVCYAYLHDVDESVFPTKRDDSKFDRSNGWPEWFMRGWTLQELIAPEQVKFFNKNWMPIGNKQRLAPTLADITGIPREVLTDGMAGKHLSVAQIMSWAAGRKTTRVEDRAYSLMGLFGVMMPMLYGEGNRAFQRLQLEIIRISNDHSIFAWHPQQPRADSVLAEDPSDFRSCSCVRRVGLNEFVDRLIEENMFGCSKRSDIDTRARHRRKLAVLRDIVKHSPQFTVSNAGIQVCLPVIPHPDSPVHFRAILACDGGSSTGLITIDLISSGSSFHRTFINTFPRTTYPEFKTLHLTHHRNECRKFTLDDLNASYSGFRRCGTYPRECTDGVTLFSITEDLIVTVYANEGDKSRFAVGLGYYFGQGWVHVVYDDRPANQEKNWSLWSDFASTAYVGMWNARGEHSKRASELAHDNEHRNVHFVKHAHLPRSILAARVVWGKWEMNNLRVMVDVTQCPGCCDGPCAWTVTFFI
ncbi:heterokaryon incompatibility protein-domain-containing protein [Pisolithus marmoratus]|nr:heterokaryon incompatibility protein-domain-containing protein [Pisolithus marmoratus]